MAIAPVYPHPTSGVKRERWSALMQAMIGEENATQAKVLAVEKVNALALGARRPRGHSPGAHGTGAAGLVAGLTA